MKTLKDIYKDNVHTQHWEEGFQSNQQLHYDLKQEAIKWIKEMNSCDIPLIISNGIPSTAEGSESYMVKNTNKSALILWIKHFFNITDEELK